MNIEELRKKIAELLFETNTNIINKIIEAVKEHRTFLTDDKQYYYIMADALIAAGIGDVKDVEHRAKTLERAFRDFLAEYLTAVNEANSYDCGIPEMFGRYANVLPYEDKVTNLLNEYLQQAEKELVEERKDD